MSLSLLLHIWCLVPELHWVLPLTMPGPSGSKCICGYVIIMYPGVCPEMSPALIQLVTWMIHMTLERLDPRTHNKLETLDHYARYVFASQFVPGKRILDIACGFGYGAKLLRGAGACHVVAIDNSEEAIIMRRPLRR